jgi:uncharacterized surface protein with fasciclin (FAS1) repeats
MKFKLLHKLKGLAAMVLGIALIASCNKDVPDAEPAKSATPVATQTIAELLNDASFSILKAAVTKAGLMEALSDRTATYTVFAPNDAAFQLSGISLAAINALPAEQVGAIVRYHVVGGQRVDTSKIPMTFPNVQLPTLLVLAQPSPTLPPGLRMSIFPSRRGNIVWANNIPVVGVNVQAVNGVLHRVAAVVAPPSAFLWNRIDADPNLTFLKAAVMRADQATPSANLVAALSNPAANLTVFAPSDAAMQQFLVGSIAQALIARGLDQATAQGAAMALVSTYRTTIISNPASIPDAPIFPAGTGIGAQLANVLTPTAIQGIILYHLLGSRAFTNNLPPTATLARTLLNNAVNAHPGVALQATLGMTGMATSASVKGVVNATASNIQINPAANGTSDQHYINGVLHVIDQVLRPQ